MCHTVLSDRFRYKDADKEEYICRTCSKDLKQNRMPAQAVANGLEVSNVPAELQGLTRLEVRCIGLRVPFMMITALPKGKRGKIRGACVNVPASLEPIAEVLPRVPENMDMVILKFKRIVISKNNYMCDYIRPYKVMTALRWLKTNNPHYVNVKIDENWLQKFAEDDSFESVIESSQVDIAIEEPPKEVELEDEDLELSDTKSNRKRDEPVQSIDVDNVQCLSNENSSDDEDERQYQEDVKESERKADITIGSSVTCIQFENPDEVAFSIAPGQNAIPKFILMDECFEALAFPNLLPYGKFGFDVLEPRERELNLRRYVNHATFE